MLAFASHNTERGIRNRAAERERQARIAAEIAHRELMLRQTAASFQTSASISFVLRDRWTAPPRVIKSKFRRIEERACRIFRVSPSAIRSERRNRELATARQFIMYWAVRRTDLSYPLIGRLLGRDHTTIMHGREAYQKKRAKQGRTLRAVR